MAAPSVEGAKPDTVEGGVELGLRGGPSSGGSALKAYPGEPLSA